MAKKLGLFSRVDARDAKKKPTSKARRGDMPFETVRLLGPKGAFRMNPRALHQNMEPRGSEDPLIYVLGEAPTDTDDIKGGHFLGRESRMLKRYIGVDKGRIRWNNLVGTCPAASRPPTKFEIECFRDNLIKDIEETKPKVILAVGSTVAQWLFDFTKKLTMDAIGGRKMMVKVGTHECFVVPVHTVAKIQEMDKRERFSDQSDLHVFFKRHVSKASILAITEEKPHRVPDTMAALRDKISLVTTIQGARAAFKDLKESDLSAFDFECFRLKPYADDALPLSIAIAADNHVYAFPLKHRKASWTDSEYAQLLDLIKDFFSQGKESIAHSAVFDLEQLLHLVGPEVARKTKWHCTFIGSHLLDVNGKGGNSLGVRCQEFLGVNPKDLAVAAANVKDLRREPLHNLLEYNALDALFTLWLHDELEEAHSERRLTRPYKRRRQCIPTLALATHEGVPIDPVEVEALITEAEEEEARALKAIMKSKAVKKYVKRKGSFNPRSNTNLAVLFRDILKRPEGEREGGKYSTDAEALKPMAASGLKIAQRILTYRSATKLLGTYLLPFRAGTPDGYVHPDGRIHPTFKPCGTRTSRLAAEDPNAQNFPKRNGKHIRRMIVAGEDVVVITGKRRKRKWVILASDYGQIEARVIAMLSKDQNYIDALLHDLDIHMDWRDRLEEAYPPCMEVFDTRKAGRDKVKNGWVFPLFFGASPRSCAKALGMPTKIADRLADEFWEDYPTIKAWQKKLGKKYEKNGYVETLIGFQRVGPLSWNEIINTPVQGTAAAIVEDAMNRISEYAHKEKIPFLQPRLSIHDDLTFCLPEEEVEFASPIIAEHQIMTPFKFVNVPLTVEQEIGPNWGEMEVLREFSTSDFA